MTRICSLCFRDATVRIDGKYKNGREATDWRCDREAPDPKTSIGSWAFMGPTDKLFRVETVEAAR